MKTKVRVGKKLTIHIPKAVAEELNIKEGDILSLRVKDNKIILEHNDAILFSIKGKKFAKITLDEIEKISEEEQNSYENPH
ncbi:AbrB/MazE/SpoVT family DNA-binding domain-containing protein [Sulfurisphaera ohwakuensis]|uniref:AbrB family looped-hinge helix DNA binding protein n=1 Tax=Sulfurisphaera ohwakuensis TaxID=69656 RepID=A0A650CHF2_SULOH|nr:AbrB/MazE/SpoVT family DNA-binding domain-containing protein [Sulfurisphaera ohwakuensis]MBB5254791.1 AbrB family looped-hinge helix DNA binding protein [Sulfurisphaera ohwakuensis]QGR17284.1 AbrB/MazE/SpoVT family DNA-binding domain-containing protein [Sulfurisphaera ohwakuensis]